VLHHSPFKIILLVFNFIQRKARRLAKNY